MFGSKEGRIILFFGRMEEKNFNYTCDRFTREEFYN